MYGVVAGTLYILDYLAWLSHPSQPPPPPPTTILLLLLEKASGVKSRQSAHLSIQPRFNKGEYIDKNSGRVGEGPTAGEEQGHPEWL